MYRIPIGLALLASMFVGACASTSAMAVTIPFTGDTTISTPVTLTEDTIYQGTGASNITFASTVDGAYSLTVSTGGAVTFVEDVGGNAPLTGLTIQGASWSAGPTVMIVGDLSVTTTGGNITQTPGPIGSIDVTGTAQLDAGTGAIALIGGYNDFVGNISASGVGIAISDANDLAFDSLTNSGNGDVSLIAGGLLVLPGAINAGTGNITLAANGGSLTSPALSGTDIGLTGASGIVLSGNITAAGTLVLQASDTAITQLAGTISVAGSAMADSGAGALHLTGASNDFVGAVNLVGGTVQIADANALSLGTLATGSLKASSNGVLGLGQGAVVGNLSATSGSGSISQAGSLTVNGTSMLDAGSGAITLNQAGNDFQASVSASGVGIAINDTNDLALGTLNAGSNGNVSVIAGGQLLLPAGAINTGTGDITLAANGGALTISGALSGNNVLLSGRDGVTLQHDVAATGIVTLMSSSGAVAQSTGIITADVLTGSATGSAILASSNHINTLNSFVAHDFSLNNGQTLTVNGPLATTAGTGNISLTTTSGALHVNTDLTGSDVSLNSAGNLLMNHDITAGTAELTSAGNITQGSGILEIGTLGGNSSGSTTLNGANQIDTLGPLVVGSSASITSARAMTVNGPLTANSGNGDIVLTTAGSSSDLMLAGAISGRQISLVAPGGSIGGTVNASDSVLVSVAPGVMEVQSGASASGAVQILSGTLQLGAGAGIGSVSVAPGATLAGIGNAGDITNHGVVSPGTLTVPYGTLSGASYTDGGGALRIAADADSHVNASLSLAGVANLGGTLSMDLAGTQPAAGDSFDVLSAHPVSGQFVAITAAGSLINPSAHYTSSLATARFGQAIAAYTAVPALNWRMLLLLAVLLGLFAARHVWPKRNC